MTESTILNVIIGLGVLAVIVYVVVLLLDIFFGGWGG